MNSSTDNCFPFSLTFHWKLGALKSIVCFFFFLFLHRVYHGNTVCHSLHSHIAKYETVGLKKKKLLQAFLIRHIIGKCLSWISQKCNYNVMGFYHSDTVSISPFESTAWDFESKQSMKAKHCLTMPFAVSDILISHMLGCLYHLFWSSISSWIKMYFQTE